MSGGGAGSGGSGSGAPGGPPTGGGRGGGYPPSGGGRAPRPQPPGPDRPISFQAEDRYWTDYLRVILPVVGLLLLLGLFWYWASSLIGDDGDSPSTPTGQAIILTQDPPTATATVPVEITPEETGEPDDNGGSQPTPPTPTPTEEPESTGGRFEIGDIVAVTENNVRMRGGPSTSAEIIIESMSADTELRITGAPTQGDGFLWWPVEDEVSGDTGWVADDFLELS